MASSKITSSRKIKEKRRKLFKEFSEGVTLHGFRFMFSRHHWGRRIFWCFLNMTISLFSILLFYEIVYDFIIFKTVTTISKEYVPLGELEFPTITICPSYSYSETKVHGIFNRYNLSIPENDDFLTNQNETLLLLELMKTNESVPSALDLKQMLQNNFSDMTNGEFMKAFAPITCKFYNEMCNHDIKSVYSWYGDPQCFQFNSFDEKSGSRKAKMVDGMSGLSIILDLKLEDAFQPDLPFQGAGILVSPYGHPYTIMEGSRNAYIKPGEFSLLKLSAIKNSEVPNPFVDSCGTQPYHIIKEGYPYKREMCWTDCILNNVYQQCDCIGEEMRSEIKLDLKVCSSIKDYSCYKNQRDAKMKTEGKHCWDNCRRTCSEMFYDLQFSSGILGSKKMYQNVLNSTSLNNTYSEVQEYLRKNVIGLFITFEDSSIISKHTSQAVSWTDLLSSIGGSIGLCLGFSLITGFEFLFFIFDYMLVPWTLQEETKKGNIGINTICTSFDEKIIQKRNTYENYESNDKFVKC